MARTIEFNMNALTMLINIIASITSIKHIIRFNKLLSKVDENIDALANNKPKYSIRVKQPERKSYVLAAAMLIFVVFLCGE